MHILYHHRTAGDRVEAVHILGMVHAFQSLGHTTEISSPPGCDPRRKQSNTEPGGQPATSEGPLRKSLKWLARKTPAVLFELFELFYNLYSLADMLRCFRRRRPDMIYERTTSNSIVPTLLARHWRIPIVQEVNVTSDIGRLRPLVLRSVTKALERETFRRAALIVTVSETFNRLLNQDHWPGEKIIVCQNAVDPDALDIERVQLARTPHHVGDGTFVIGYVGAFVPYHRIDLMVAAACDFAPLYPRARWLLVGDGVERPRIERLLTEFGLEEKFWMPGNVPHEAVPSYIMAMDAAVLPNSETYNSPMKRFEYMAMGKPVIAPRVPAIEEVVRHEETG